MLYYSKLQRDIHYAQVQRDQKHDELDGMSFIEYYKSNAKAANSYLPPKQNEADIRITSGITKEKVNTILSNLLNYEFEADIEAFDQDDEQVAEIGEVMEDMVKKSEKMESQDFDQKIEMIYKELLDQGSVCVEETQREYTLPRKIKGKMEDYTIKECSAELICGLDLYFGNIRQPFIEFQPYIVKRRLISRKEAKSLYGHLDRWKFVPDKASQILENGQVQNWVMFESEPGLVEEVKYMSKWDDDYQLLLNGVMMFPVTKDGAASLSDLIGVCEYPFAYAVLESIPNFVYGKSIPAKTKVDQAVYDEFVKMSLIKTRKSYMPPLANNSSTQLSRKIFDAGMITDGIKPEQLQEIGTNTGVTGPEFNMLQFLKSQINDKSVSSVMEGNTGNKNQSATEIATLQKQSMIKQGVSILSVTVLRRKMAWLRLQDIIENWTKETDTKLKVVNGILTQTPQYRSVNMPSNFDQGGTGMRSVEFTKQLPTSEQVLAEEEMVKMATGKNIKKHYIDPDQLRDAKLKWYIEVVPSPRETSELRKKMFMESIAQGMQLFGGPQAFNQEYLKGRFAQDNNMDKSKLFAEQQMGLPPGMPGQSQLGAQMMPQGPNRPSINTLQNS